MTPVAKLHASRLSVRDLLGEALAGITQRPLRTVLTGLGGVLGIGTMVAVLGLTATSSGQISDAFTVWTATEVRVTDAGPDLGGTVNSFPTDADSDVLQLNGVQAAGRTWGINTLEGPQQSATTSLDPRSRAIRVDVAAASPGYLSAVGATYASGRGFDAFHRKQNVAVLGPSVARALVIASVGSRTSVYLDGVGYTVIGILSDVQRDPAVLGSVIIPDVAALTRYGNPSSLSPMRMLISTDLGAAKQVAREAALAIRPDRPDLLRVEPVPEPSRVEGAVSQTLNTLFLALAGITLFIGAAGIANTTLVSVMERTPEIGLRRAIGARRRHIAAQFLSESALVGGLGGLIGTALGNGVVIGTAVSQSWTALLNPAITLTAPLLGAVIGLVAGLYPAIRASTIQPAIALRK